MLLSEQLLQRQSKAQARKITDWALKDPEHFRELAEVVLRNEGRTSELAAWPFNEAAREAPQLVLPYSLRLFKLIEKGCHHAVSRNILRIYEDVPIPRKVLGMATELCFRILSDPQRSIAERAYSMTILERITEQEPDLKRELRLVTEACMEEGVPALIARGRPLLKKLRE